MRAVNRKKKPFSKAYQSPDNLLQDPEIQSILHSSKLSADTLLKETNTKVAILARLSATCDEPVPSNVLGQMTSASKIAAWYSERLKPVGATPHTRKIIFTTLATSSDANDKLNDRIDLDREAIQGEFMSTIPKNLRLDDKIFRDPTPVGLRDRRAPHKAFARKRRS